MDGRRWTLAAGITMAAVFSTALVIRILPEIALVGVGSRAPEFQAVDLGTGRPATLADYRGRVVLLNVWATWCQPCRIEMPAMVRLSRGLAGTDFRFVGVCVDVGDSALVSAFAMDLGLTFDILHDRPGPSSARTRRPASRKASSSTAEIIVKKVIGAAEWDAPVNQLLIRRLLDDH
jgi:thiol-disulfide isomerase/thioredoxin